jgi:tetratricopeptide (TPR) repeat protein
MVECDTASQWMEKGLALAKKEKFRESLSAFSMGLSYDPLNDRLYRHRGHRYISIAEYPEAAADLKMATRLDETKRDSWYHLGLAYYLLEDFHRAESAYRIAFERASSEQELVSTVDWLWMTLMRLDKREEAQELLDHIPETLNPGENSSYFERVMLYKGLRKIEDFYEFKGAQSPEIELANQGYGIATYLFFCNKVEESNALLLKIIKNCPKQWAFGYRAAEVDLKSRGLLQVGC